MPTGVDAQRIVSAGGDEKNKKKATIELKKVL
jgi:hypothetical protein